jgi:hypothetical protein
MSIKKMGGVREGAGRKPSEATKESLSIRVSTTVKEWLKGQEESAGVIIERELVKLIKKGNKNVN